MKPSRSSAEPVTHTELVVGFDLDMTLVDSAGAITATLQAAIEATPGGAGVRLRREQVWPWIGLPMEPTAAALAPLADPEAVARAYRARFATIGLPQVRLLPGAVEALRAVHWAGGRILVISAKAQAGVHEVLTAVGLDREEVRPDLVVGGLFAAAKGERLLLEGARVYVGDHPGDVEAAKVAGAVSVAVATGPHDATSLAAAGADVVLPDLMGFPSWLSMFCPNLTVRG
jgi:phosphoglycolate phosphatase